MLELIKGPQEFVQKLNSMASKLTRSQSDSGLQGALLPRKPTKVYRRNIRINSFKENSSCDEQPAPQAPARPNRGNHSRDLPAVPSPNTGSRTRVPQPKPQQEIEEDEYAEPEPEPPAPVRGRPPPPVPSGHPPPVPADDHLDEDYEDPDAPKPQNFHRGPLPTLPPAATPPLGGQRGKVPIGQRKQPAPPEPVSDEEYEDPDSKPPRVPPAGHRPPPLPPMSTVPTRHHAPAPEPPLIQEEAYEDPDNTVSKAPPIGQRPPPPPPVSSVPSRHHEEDTAEDYIEPEAPTKAPPVGHRHPPPPLPLPSIPGEEAYEDPDEMPSRGQPAPPPVSSVPTMKKHTKSAPPPADEDYEEPESPPSVPRHQAPLPGSRGRQQAPLPTSNTREPAPLPSSNTREPAPPKVSKIPGRSPAPVKEQETYEVPDAAGPTTTEEVYEVPDAEDNKPTKSPRRAPMPLPVPEQPKSTKKNISKAVLDSQETYEIPDNEEEVKEIKPKKVHGIALPGMPAMTNGTSHSSPTQPHRRNLPPTPKEEPTVEPPRRIKADKVAKTEPVTPVTPANQEAPREMTEADYMRQKWYHGDISRNDADTKLKNHSLDGMYLIRKSSKGNPYTLQIYYKTRTYNLPIRKRDDNMFAVGQEKANEKGFTNLLDMVNYFKTNKLVLAQGGETKLVKSLPK